jgi:cysteinyl-tRNA synthetase
MNSAMDEGRFGGGNRDSALDLLSCFDRIFDVLRPSATANSLSDEEINERVAARNAAKKARNYAEADAIRASLLGRGVLIEDTKDGVRWKRK